MALLKNIFKLLALICVCSLITLGCAEKDKYEALKADIVTPAQDREIIEGETLYFQGAASGGTPPYLYRWDFSVVAPSSSKQNPGEIAFNYKGAYKVSFTVKDTKGNIHTDFVRIIVEEDKYGIKSKKV
jgi:hypothetical protein